MDLCAIDSRNWGLNYEGNSRRPVASWPSSSGTFLNEAGWIQGRQTRGHDRSYYPPASLGIQGKYLGCSAREYIEAGCWKSLAWGSQLAGRNLRICKFGRLTKQGSVAQRPISATRIITRFIDGTTLKAAMPLASLASYASSMEAGLYRSAKFKLGAETKETKLIAQRFREGLSILTNRAG